MIKCQMLRSFLRFIHGVWYVLEGWFVQHALNAPLNHYLENIEILSSLYVHIKQGM